MNSAQNGQAMVWAYQTALADLGQLSAEARELRKDYPVDVAATVLAGQILRNRRGMQGGEQRLALRLAVALLLLADSDED